MSIITTIDTFTIITITTIILLNIITSTDYCY